MSTFHKNKTSNTVETSLCDHFKWNQNHSLKSTLPTCVCTIFDCWYHNDSGPKWSHKAASTVFLCFHKILYTMSKQNKNISAKQIYIIQKVKRNRFNFSTKKTSTFFSQRDGIFSHIFCFKDQTWVTSINVFEIRILMKHPLFRKLDSITRKLI